MPNVSEASVKSVFENSASLRLCVGKNDTTGCISLLDISADTARHTVVAAGTEEVYQGHPTTVLTRTGKLLCVWCVGHGGPCGPGAESLDGGHTWTRIDDRFPAAYAATHQNCPTLQKMTLPDGRERLLVFSAKRITTEYTEHTESRFANARTTCPLGIVYSDDDGLSWRESPPVHLCSVMPPTGFLPLRDGSVALFGQIRRNPKVATDHPTDDQVVWMSTSRDGLSWSEPRIVAAAPEKNLCEPCALRSPDGREIALLLRENRHAGCSMMCFSSDEGQTWSAPTDTAPELTGDRHEGVVLPDGRLFIAFRDRMPTPCRSADGSSMEGMRPSGRVLSTRLKAASPIEIEKDGSFATSTYGHYVAWVGTWDDLRHARPGLCRIKLLHSYAGDERFPNPSFVGDTGYSGVELLVGTAPRAVRNGRAVGASLPAELLCTTYIKYWSDARCHSIVSTRLRLDEIDHFTSHL